MAVCQTVERTVSRESFDVDDFLAASYEKLHAQKAKEARELRKEITSKRRETVKKIKEVEQSLTTLEEIWERLCASHGPSPFSLEAWKFVDTMYSCTQAGLGSDLAAVANGRSCDKPLNLHARDIAYLCYLLLEGHAPEQCGPKLLDKMSDPEFQKTRSDDVLQHHIVTHLRLHQFRDLILIITGILHLDETYVLSALVWVEAERFEMPEFLYTRFFQKCNSHRFLENRGKTSSDHEHVRFGQLNENSFMRLCHSLQIVDCKEQTGKAWEFCINFWKDFLKNIDENVNRYVDRRPGAKSASDAKARHHRERKIPDLLTGRTELTALLEQLFLQMPKGSYKSPLHLCFTYLSEGEETEHVGNDRQTPISPPQGTSAKCFCSQPNSLKQEITKLFKIGSDGDLERDDLARLLRIGNASMKDSDIEALFRLADHNHDGRVDFGEFCDFIFIDGDPLGLALQTQSDVGSKKANTVKDIEKVKCLRQFAEKDTDGSATLDFDELCDLLRSGNPKWTDSEVRTLFNAADVDGSGLIDYHEFVDYIWSKSTKQTSANPDSRRQQIRTFAKHSRN